jgi:hypothetical protein
MIIIKITTQQREAFLNLSLEKKKLHQL